ncbi:hypothetical protein [Halomicrobium salinisoli]|uniref:hypothetical protein n=1 Tax=Halomicrobium salinisoli TaxID=2878391 RepID=UPI001CF01696|nr:hypothetical protein [Halomicrobium salinisoli]
MTDTDDTTAVESTVDADDGVGTNYTAGEPAAEAGDGDDDADLVDYVQWSLLAILLLVALVATFRFYFSMSTAIDNFVSREFRPLFQAAFNLAILLACGAGLTALVRRIR